MPGKIIVGITYRYSEMDLNARVVGCKCWMDRQK